MFNQMDYYGEKIESALIEQEITLVFLERSIISIEN
jgi:hypothetical protein